VVQVELSNAIDATLTEIASQVAAQSRCIKCTAQILSLVSPDGEIITCVNNVCPGVPDEIMQLLLGTARRRRSLLATTSLAGWKLNIGMISTVALPTAQPVITIGNTTLNATSKINAVVPAAEITELLNNATQFLNTVNNYVPPPSTTRPVRVYATPPQAAETDTTSSSAQSNDVAIIAGAVGGLVGVLAVGGGAVCYVRSRKAARKKAAMAEGKKQDDAGDSQPSSTMQAQFPVLTPGLINIRISHVGHI
jgi:hypothetical protein